MEHLFNCHGEWGIFLCSLPVIGMAWVYTRNQLQRFWKFLYGLFVRIQVYCQLVWMNRKS